jgi:hypothetical protein
MSISGLSRCALSASVVAAMLTGCGALPFDSAQGRLAQDGMPIGAPGVRRDDTLYWQPPKLRIA